jgi:hypothetical protein
VRNQDLTVAKRAHRSRDGAISLEALVIAEGVVQDDACCDSLVLLDQRVCQAVPGRLGGERRDNGSVVRSKCRNSGSRYGEQLLHHNHARDSLQTAFYRDALIVRAFEQLIERR